MNERTPGRWQLAIGDVRQNIYIVAPGPITFGNVIAKMDKRVNDEADATYIIQACNGWSDVKALRARLLELTQSV